MVWGAEVRIGDRLAEMNWADVFKGLLKIWFLLQCGWCVGDLGVQMAQGKWTVSVHGGAFGLKMPKHYRPEAGLAEVGKALDRAVDVVTKKSPGVLLPLSENSTLAMRAAVEAVVHMEDRVEFNAGVGSVLTSENGVEIEAGVMEGSTQDSGACCGVGTFPNPILLAELVRTRTKHTLIGYDGIEKLGRDWGLESKPTEHFVEAVKEYRRKRKEEWAAGEATVDADSEPKGTVGAVVLDMEGNLAVAVSTGGKTDKLPGRIGDSPCIAAGSFANQFAAVCGTGNGEDFVNGASCAQVCFMMEYGGIKLEDAVKQVIHEKMVKGSGGIIAVSRDGEVAMECNSAGMFRGFADSNGNREVYLLNKDSEE